MLREGAKRLARRNLGRLIVAGEQCLAAAELVKRSDARCEREDEVEGVAYPAGEGQRLLHPFNRAVRIPSNPVGEASGPVLRKDKRVMVRQPRDAAVPVAVIDGGEPVGMKKRARA